jgi:type I restriction enzyme S subunit
VTELADLVDLTVGFAFKSSDFTEDPNAVRLIRGDNIGQGQLRWQGVKRLPVELAEGLDKYRLEPGDVVLAMDRPWIEAGLKYAVVRETDAPSFLVQRVARLRARDGLDQKFLGYVVGGYDFTRHVLAVQTGTSVPHISGKQIAEFSIKRLPSIEEQRGIAAALGALDEKIESNQRMRLTLRRLGAASVLACLAGDSSRCAMLSELTDSIARGVTPKYADADPEAYTVLNQKCVRANWVSTGPARLMVYRDLAPAKVVSDGDILVNSTGTGTLGRVGRWHTGTVFADSHVSIVKPATDEIGPTLLAYLMFGLQDEIEQMATGSTGQTELSASRLGELVIEYPGQEDSLELEGLLLAIEDRADSLRVEEQRLGALRDTLLPELLSGRICVPEAAEAVAEATA